MVLTNEMQETAIRDRLAVDERPLKRLAKSLLGLASLKPSVESEGSPPFDIDLEFMTYQSSLKRIIALHKANNDEVARYLAASISIQAQAQRTREDIRQLKHELSQEQAARDDRASYDQLANDMHETAPRSRKQQNIAILKLRDEITELETEKAEYHTVWQTRKKGFEDIMTRLIVLQKEITGEKETAELRTIDSDDEGAVSDKDEETVAVAASKQLSQEAIATDTMDTS